MGYRGAKVQGIGMRVFIATVTAGGGHVAAGALDFLAAPRAHKQQVLESLFQRFPQHRFVLVGDSGEQDPEVYAGMARRYRDRVVAIWIRDVTGEGADEERYQALRDGLGDGQFQVFKEPTGIVLPGAGE